MTFNSAEEKYAYVNNMFSRIAERYDLMNRVMTGGQDIHWRKSLIEVVHLPSVGGRILDLATGTGDIAFEALRQHPTLDMTVGADYTLPMMAVGQKRERHPDQATPRPVCWTGADALYLPFPDEYFDAVVSGFLMRNVVDVRQSLIEQVRVCKTGGRVAILEIPRPADTLFGHLFRLYFHHVVPLLGGLISGQPDAYTYLPASADAFLWPKDLKAEMEEIGLEQVQYQLLMLGTVALHVGEKG